MHRLLLWLMILWPGALLAASPVPTGLYAQVDHGLRPATVLADPESYRDRTLLLGGEVVRTVSEAGSVWVELDCYTLTGDDRPDQPAPALGRILVTGANLDGARLQPGRLVTLVGTVAGRDAAGAAHLPLLIAGFLYPWPTAAEEDAARAAASSCDGCCSPWYDPWYYSGCSSWYYGPYPRWDIGFGYYYHHDHHHGH